MEFVMLTITVKALNGPNVGTVYTTNCPEDIYLVNLGMLINCAAHDGATEFEFEGV